MKEMFRPTPQEETEPFLEQEFAFDIKNPQDQEKLLTLLRPILGEEASEQFLFTLQTLDVEDKGEYINHCNKATQKFGEILSTQIGGEESFFDIVPNSEYYDVHGIKLQEKFGYRGSYHSIGMVETQGTTIIIDYTYSTVNKMSPKPRMILILQGDEKIIEKKLHEHYGGKWQKTFQFNKQTKKYLYLQ